MKRVMWNLGKAASTPSGSAGEESALDALVDSEFDTGAGVPLEEAAAWVESWFTPNELPVPKARKLT